jgi:NAD(P)-dependent dehydrogenase (short-subunit alcohol dehydrogenase family)
MDLQLVGKKALVTGSTAGIGLATAKGLYKEGASVYVNGRNPQRVDQAIGQIKAIPTIGTPDISGVAADLGTADGVTARNRTLGVRDGVFQVSPPDFVVEAFRNGGRGGKPDRLCVQSSGISD